MSSVRSASATTTSGRRLPDRELSGARIFMHQLYYKSFADVAPYNIVWVALDEGPMMTANVVGSLREDIEVGSRVVVEFEAVTEQVTLPRFFGLLSPALWANC